MGRDRDGCVIRSALPSKKNLRISEAPSRGVASRPLRLLIRLSVRAIIRDLPKLHEAARQLQRAAAKSGTRSALAISRTVPFSR